MRRCSSNVAVRAANSPRKHGLRGLASCRRGSVALEFALVCTPLMLIVFGFIATSAVFNTWSTMQSNAQYAARLVSTGQVTKFSSGTVINNNSATLNSCSSPTAGSVEAYACAGLPNWSTYSVTTTENCAVPSVTVTLSSSAATAAIVDIEKIFTGKTISATAVVMKEGTCP